MAPKINVFLSRLARHHHYPYLAAAGLVLVLLFELVPRVLMPGYRWLFLVSVLATVFCCIDLNLMLWRVYHRRGDFKPLRVTLALVSGFVTLLTISRVLGFASFFCEALLATVSVANLASGLLAAALVLKARTAECFVLDLPSVTDLTVANRELSGVLGQLHLREATAFEAMFISSGDVIQEANPAAYRLLGYCEATHELIGMRAHQLLHADDTPIVYKQLQRPTAGPYTVRALTKQGQTRYVQVMGSTFERQPGDPLRLTNFRDVTTERHYLRLVEEIQVYPAADTPAALNDQALRDINELRATYFPNHFPAHHAPAD